MTDRPIIFSAPMVRALLDGRKTQTRRLASSPLAKAQPGDRLWVRESMRIDTNRESLIYAATDTTVPKGSFAWQAWLHQYGGNAVPSIHMPRWASRLTLIVEAVKVEPLHDITEADAIAEGIARNPVQEGTWIDYPEGTSAAGWDDPRECFRSLWSSIHGDFVWWANPDIVALTFRVVRANIDSLTEGA